MYWYIRAWLSVHHVVKMCICLFQVVYKSGAQELVTGNAPVQNGVVFIPWVLQVPKYHLVPEYNLETLYPGTGTVS